AIDHDAQPAEIHGPGQRALGEFDVAVLYAVDTFGAPEIGAFGQMQAEIGIEQRLDLELDFVVELVAIGPEQLDPVVVERIVRSGDHHAKVRAHRARQHADGWRRNRAGKQHIHADGREAGNQRGLDHVTGKARVLADQYAVTVVAVLEHKTGRLANPERKLRRDHAVGAAANAV